MHVPGRVQLPVKSRWLLAVPLAAAPVLWLLLRADAPEALARGETAPAALRALDSDMESFYAMASLEQVSEDIELLRGLLDEGTLEYYNSQFSQGNSVVEGHFTPKESYELHTPGNELCARRFLASCEVRKVVLPRDRFPEMYDLRDRIEWLVHRQAELEAFGGAK